MPRNSRIDRKRDTGDFIGNIIIQIIPQRKPHSSFSSSSSSSWEQTAATASSVGAAEEKLCLHGIQDNRYKEDQMHPTKLLFLARIHPTSSHLANTTLLWDRPPNAKNVLKLHGGGGTSLNVTANPDAAKPRTQ